MDYHPKIRGLRYPRTVVTPALTGLFCSTVLIFAAVTGTKWLVASSLGLAGLFFLFIVNNLRFTFLLMAVFSLPIHLDFNLIYKKTNYAQFHGLPVTLFDIFFAFLLLYWIRDLLLKKNKIDFFPLISIPALSYIILAGVTTLFSPGMMLSVSMLLLIIKGYVIFLYFANNIRSERDLFWIVIVLSTGILMQSIIGILQNLTGGTLGLGGMFGETERAFRVASAGSKYMSRVGGTIGDANSLAMYLNLILPLLLCFSLSNINLMHRVFVGMIFLLGVITEILTRSRGGWIALTAGLIITFYIYFRGKFNSGLKSAVITTLTILIIVGGVLVVSEDVNKRLFKTDYGSAASRIPMIKVAWNIIKENPVWGVGLNNYSVEMNRYDHTRENISYKFPYPVHNAFLLIAAETGVPSLVCYLLIIAGVFRMSAVFFKRNDFISLCGIGALCGIITWSIHSLIKWDYAGINIGIWLLFASVAAMHRMLTTSNNQQIYCSNKAK